MWKKQLDAYVCCNASTGKIKRGAKVAHFNEGCRYTRNFVQEVCAPPKLFNVPSTERTSQTPLPFSLCKSSKKTASLFVGRAKRSSVLLWHVASRTNAIYYHSSTIFFSYSLRFSPLLFPSFPSSFFLFPFFFSFKALKTDEFSTDSRQIGGEMESLAVKSGTVGS